MGNLIHAGKRTPEERCKNGRKGGLHSGVVRRHRKEMRELAEIALQMDVTDTNIINIIQEILPDVHEDEITVGYALVIAQFKKALSGDVRAAIFIRDLAEGKSRLRAEPVKEPPNISIRIVPVSSLKENLKLEES